ncbi:UNVERIFIED_CONTAM: hypothetical protein GTU68_035334 [Idotea baltica]|nr:hypothetical protein [Idotea baltica]
MRYGDVSRIPTKAFFYGLEKGEEIVVTIALGKNIIIEYLNTNEVDDRGNRLVIFRINGDIRSVSVKDLSATQVTASAIKAVRPNEIGSPLQGSLAKVLVREGDTVKAGDGLFIIEAMKMESTITAPMAGVIKKVYLQDKTLVSQDDMVLEIEVGE